MSTTVQLNTRIEPGLKTRGDAVFSRAGLTSSDVVRAVWSWAARMQRVPECIEEQVPVGGACLAAIAKGTGLAARWARENGITLSTEPIDYHTLRDGMYDDMLKEIESRHA